MSCLPRRMYQNSLLSSGLWGNTAFENGNKSQADVKLINSNKMRLFWVDFQTLWEPWGNVIVLKRAFFYQQNSAFLVDLLMCSRKLAKLLFHVCLQAIIFSFLKRGRRNKQRQFIKINETTWGVIHNSFSSKISMI